MLKVTQAVKWQSWDLNLVVRLAEYPFLTTYFKRKLSLPKIENQYHLL